MDIVSKVRDHIPLEQGLRLLYYLNPDNVAKRQRPYSIRTRIKTLRGLVIVCPTAGSETIFH